MRKVILLVVLYLSIKAAHASELDSIPYGDFGKYQSAFDAARRSLFLQIGFEQGFMLYRNALNDRANRLILNSGYSTELGTCLFIYRIYREKSVSFPLSNSQRLSLRTDGFQFRLEW